ncbi:WD repeat-containing protein 81 [Nymphon striatum]|nr:WD repeat-containing protein 81 [Nymphon striatum]
MNNYRRKCKLYFKNSTGDILSIQRCLLHGKHDIPECETDLVSRVKCIYDNLKWAIILIGGGHFAAGIFNKDIILNHKTFHRYTVRAKQGSSQNQRDMKNGGSHSKSAGASLRRYNEASLILDIQNLLSSWKDELKSIRATLHEVKRIHQCLMTIEIIPKGSELNEKISSNFQPEYSTEVNKHNSVPTDVDAKHAQINNLNSPKPNKKKRKKIKKQNIPSNIEKHKSEPCFKLEDDDEEMAQGCLLIAFFIMEPIPQLLTISSSHQFVLAKDIETKSVFQEFKKEFPDKYEYELSKIPNVEAKAKKKKPKRKIKNRIKDTDRSVEVNNEEKKLRLCNLLSIRLQQIYFTSAKMMKKKLDKEIQTGNAPEPPTQHDKGNCQILLEWLDEEEIIDRKDSAGGRNPNLPYRKGMLINVPIIRIAVKPSCLSCNDVHADWLKSLITKGSLPKQFISNPSLTTSEVKLLLCQSSYKPVHPWLMLFIQVIDKQDNIVKGIGRKQDLSDNAQLLYSQIIHYVSESNYKNLWREANSKLPTLSVPQVLGLPAQTTKKNVDIIREVLKRLYSCTRIMLNDENSTSKITYSEGMDERQHLRPAGTVHSAASYIFASLLDMVMNVKDIETENTLQSCITFSPSILESSPLKNLFVIYQLLNVIRDIHDKGLHVGNISLDNLLIDDSLWLQVNPQSWLACNDFVGKTIVPEICSKVTKESVSNPETIYPSSELIEIQVKKWIHGALSNFEYLLILNELAGRSKANPNYYPVLPWIMDFTVPKGGWRDFSKSKYRLNKGDQQLDLTYDPAALYSNSTSEAEGNTYHPNIPHTQVPHHVSDVLSDITYYVYKARSTPKSILCKHVRSKWVPAEYPSSMQRLQEWTPDECIPEFFDDPSIFVSIHDDLPDLEIPWWADNYDDFILKHRAALESDHISKRLHHWIDLTFGYKLVGPAAIASKNVCLHLVDKHNNLINSGVVQLFNHPHPRKRILVHTVSNSLVPPSFGRKRFKGSLSVVHFQLSIYIILNFEESDSSELTKSDNFSGSTKQKRKDSSSKYVILSITCGILCRSFNVSYIYFRFRHSSLRIEDRKSYDYNALGPLIQYESEYNFLVKSNLFDSKEICYQSNDDESFKRSRNKVRDIQVLACLISELYLAPKLRTKQAKRSLNDRYKAIKRLLNHSHHDLPREVREIVKTLMQMHNSSHELPHTYPAVSSIGLPPPSAHQLIQPLIKGFSFPNYFDQMYSLLSKLKEYSRLLNEIQLSVNLSESVRSSLIESISESKVKLSAKVLSELLPQLNQESVEIIVPCIKELVDDQATCVSAVWELFDIVATSLGPRQSSLCFLSALLKIFSGERSSSKYLKLFHRTFLLQLIIGLGLKTFLTYFSTLLVEAVSGFKDFGSHDEYGVHEETDGHSKKGSFLGSPQLHQHESGTDHEDSTETSPGNVLSPFKDKANCCNDEDTLEPEIFWLESPILEDNKSSTSSVIEDATAIKDEDSISSDGSIEHDGISLSDNGELEAIHALGIKNSEPCSIPKSMLDVISTDEKYQVDQKLSSSMPVSSEKVQDYLQSQDTSSYQELSYISVFFNLFILDMPLKENHCDSMITEEHTTEYNICNVAAESIMWLSHRLGPVLSSKYLCRNLLRMLPLCYLEKEQLHFISLKELDSNMIEETHISKESIAGDINSLKIIKCLTSIATLYGEQIIMLQYFPYVTEQVRSCKKRVSEIGEAGLLSCLFLLYHIIPYLSDATLMDCLQELLLKDILYPSVQLLSSIKLSFPGGGMTRYLICNKLIDVLYIIGLRIGFEMTRNHLSIIIHRFFLSFDRIPEYQQLLNGSNEPNSMNKTAAQRTYVEDQYLEIRKNSHNEYIIGPPVSSVETFHKRCNTPPVIDDKISDDILAELKIAFCPKLASSVYIAFCKLAGGIFMDETLTNEGLIRALCKMYDDTLGKNDIESRSDKFSSEWMRSQDKIPPSTSATVSGKFGGNVAVVGNRIDLSSNTDSHCSSAADYVNKSLPSIQNELNVDITKAIHYKMENCSRHLRGNWLAYWEHELGCSDKNEKFNFKQIKLQTFMGHSNSIKSIHVLNNENSFMTGSKDKTVKLWSLRSQGDGSHHTSCQFSYTNHKKSVYSVTFLDSVRLVGSCDGSVHIWDPFMGACVRQFETNKNTILNLLTVLPPPSQMFVAATSDSTLKFLDARSLKYAHEYKVNINPTGLIRSVGVSPSGNWLAIGHSTGIISVLDLRTGFIRGFWKGHEGEILQLKVFNENTFVTSSLDYMITAWNANENKARFHLKGPTEPVTCLNFFNNQVITGTTANRIGVHNSLESQVCKMTCVISYHAILFKNTCQLFIYFVFFQANFSSTKLRSDTFKGVLTSSAVLPLNKLLLLGSDTGSVSLLC